eukprot:m.22021 g.22021  ORF g.22021 m.22021 type:complete len:80 (-) comp7320_c0_seq1:65-304(-)
MQPPSWHGSTPAMMAFYGGSGGGGWTLWNSLANYVADQHAANNFQPKLHCLQLIGMYAYLIEYFQDSHGELAQWQLPPC